MKWIAVVLVLSRVAVAAESGCPGKVIGAVAGLDALGCSPQRYCLVINFNNKSDRKIVGAKFGVEYLDAVGDLHGSAFNYTSNATVMPAKKHQYIWWIRPADMQDASRGTVVWIEKLFFEDGSTWQDSGSKTCGWRDR